MNAVMKSWYQLLNGNLSVDVFMVDAPAGYEGNYVLIRPESDSDTPNNHAWRKNPVIITEVVTKNMTMVDYTTAGDIDDEITSLLYTSPMQHNLPAQDDIHITSVQRRDAQYLPEDDGTTRINRLITRNVHRVEQLINQS